MHGARWAIIRAGYLIFTGPAWIRMGIFTWPRWRMAGCRSSGRGQGRIRSFWWGSRCGRLGSRGRLLAGVLVFLQPRHLDRLQLGFVRGLGVVVKIVYLSDPLVQIRVADIGGVEIGEFFAKRQRDIFA